MDFFVANLEAGINIVALIISAIGAGFSVAAFVQAGKARTAADAAEKASQKTQDSITNILTVVDLQKAISAIQRLKLLHREESWKARLENYQPLRSMLADIEGRQTLLTDCQTSALKEFIPQLASIEDAVTEALRDGIDPSSVGSFSAIISLHEDPWYFEIAMEPRLRILDREGKEIDRYDAVTVGSSQVTSDKLGSLYKSARRVALNVDQQLDGLLGELSQT